MLQHVGDLLLHSVEVGHLAEHAVAAALGARAVVTVDQEDQGVVELSGIFDRLDQATNLVVGHLDVRSEHLRLAREEALLVR